jgi:hypothetical protein
MTTPWQKAEIGRTVAHRPAGGQAATIGRVVQTEECKASRQRWQFDCSYSGDNGTLYLSKQRSVSQHSAESIFIAYVQVYRLTEGWMPSADG